MARKSRPARKLAVKKQAKAKAKTAKSSAPKTAAAKSPKVDKAKAAKPAAKTAARPAAKEPASKLAVGMVAPTFSLPRDGGSTVSLTDFAGQKLALYFYPRADTPGCTREAIDFSRLRDAFAKANTQVVGVSADPVPAQDKFKAKYKLSFALASDEKHRMIEAYGVWQEKSLYGRKFMGIVRSTFLIGADGRVARIWPKVFVDGHADDVLAAAKAL